MREPTVFIVDDDEAYRDSLMELVASVGLPGECFASAQEFLERHDARHPGCLVLDVRMARLSGIALQARLKAAGATIPIVFISGHGDIQMAVAALKRGAVDFVEKPYREQQLLDAINEALVQDAEQRAANDRAAAPADVADKLSGLTPRERETMELALAGKSSKAIAAQLGISYRTVELHRSRILEKLGAGSIAELARRLGSLIR